MFWKTILASVCVEWFGLGRDEHWTGLLKAIQLRKIQLVRMIYVYKVTYIAKQSCRLVNSVTNMEHKFGNSLTILFSFSTLNLYYPLAFPFDSMYNLLPKIFPWLMYLLLAFRDFCALYVLLNLRHFACFSFLLKGKQQWYHLFPMTFMGSVIDLRTNENWDRAPYSSQIRSPFALQAWLLKHLTCAFDSPLCAHSLCLTTGF